MPAPEQQIAADLGYELKDKLYPYPGAQHRSWVATPTDDPDRKVVLRVARAHGTDDWNAHDTMSVTMRTGVATGPAADTSESESSQSGPSVKALEAAAQQNWILSAKGSGHLFAPIEKFGKLERLLPSAGKENEVDTEIFSVRPYYRFTLKNFVEKEVPLDHDQLYHVVSGIWRALSFIHQPKINIPHRRLHLANVGVDGFQITKSEILLLDSEFMVDVAETGQSKIDDFMQLGLIAFNLASGNARTLDPYDAAAKCQSAEWPQLKHTRKNWQNFFSRVLNSASYGNQFDPILDGNDWLKPLRPSGAKVIALVKPLRDIDLPDPPRVEVEDDQVPAIEETPDLLSVLQNYLDAGDAEAVLQTAYEQKLENVEDRPLVREILNQATDLLSEDRRNDKVVMKYLEKAGNFGATHAILRYGQALLLA